MPEAAMDGLASRIFGTLPAGETIEAVTLTNASGSSAEILTFGAILRTLKVPDRDGRLADVVLGFEQLDPYVSQRAFFGAAVGRVAGRITDGRILIDGSPHWLPCNEGRHHLHGGAEGFDRRVWKVEQATEDNGGSSLTLRLESPDGDQSYPGNLSVRLTYTLTRDNALVIETEATSDQPTPVSLTHHSYFNLAGEGSGTVLDHGMQILAETFVPMNSKLTLQDRKQSVVATPVDWRHPRVIRKAVPDLSMQHGDLYLIRDPASPPPDEPQQAARVLDLWSGRIMEVLTNEPCLQLYTGVSIHTEADGKAGRGYGPFDGFCLEAQGYPNATTVEGFGDIVARPGTVQRRRTVYAFSTL